jgi:hypothetical protein
VTPPQPDDRRAGWEPATKLAMRPQARTAAPRSCGAFLSEPECSPRQRGTGAAQPVDVAKPMTRYEGPTHCSAPLESSHPSDVAPP